MKIFKSITETNPILNINPVVQLMFKDLENLFDSFTKLGLPSTKTTRYCKIQGKIIHEIPFNRLRYSAQQNIEKAIHNISTDFANLIAKSSELKELVCQLISMVKNPNFEHKVNIFPEHVNAIRNVTKDSRTLADSKMVNNAKIKHVASLKNAFKDLCDSQKAFSTKLEEHFESGVRNKSPCDSM